jgi:hypothetical protein
VQRLEQLFMPATVQMQRLYGLTAYLPAVLPESSGHPLPDEVALVFYRTQECYHEAKSCIGGRAYSELHELAFDMAASRSGFPLLLQRDQVTADQPYNLFERSVDWQTGGTRLFVGTRKTITPSDVFLDSIAKTARRVQQEPKSLDAAIFCATGDWIVWWDHAQAPLSEPVSYFEGLADTVWASGARRLRVPPDLTEPYAGISLNTQGDFVNLLFPRV